MMRWSCYWREYWPTTTHQLSPRSMQSLPSWSFPPDFQIVQCKHFSWQIDSYSVNCCQKEKSVSLQWVHEENRQNYFKTYFKLKLRENSVLSIVVEKFRFNEQNSMGGKRSERHPSHPHPMALSLSRSILLKVTQSL